jgi:hypothetical protein
MMKTINEIGKLLTATFIIAVALLITLYTTYELIIELGIIGVGVILALVVYILSSKWEKRLEEERDSYNSSYLHWFNKYGVLLTEYKELEIDLANQVKATDELEKSLEHQLKVRPEQRKQRLENFNGTDIHTFFFLMSEFNWNYEESIFKITIEDDFDNLLEIGYKELKEKYEDYFIADYDLWHEIIDDNYITNGWLQLFKDDIPFSEQDNIQDNVQVYSCLQCGSSNVRETPKMIICNECGKRRKK